MRTDEIDAAQVGRIAAEGAMPLSDNGYKVRLVSGIGGACGEDIVDRRSARERVSVSRGVCHPPNMLEHFEAALGGLTGDRLGLVLDFDGTLSEFVPDLDKAVI